MIQQDKVKGRANMKVMVNPFPKEVSDSVLNVIKQDNPDAALLRDQVKDFLAEKLGIDSQEILLGKSTTATSELVFTYLFTIWNGHLQLNAENGSQKPKALIPSPTYNGIVTQLNNIGWDVIEQEYVLSELYSPSYFESFFETIQQQRPHIVVMANPNNPTGAFFKPENVAAVCAEVSKYGGFVVVDEAYLRAVDPNGALSAVQLLRSDCNSLIILESVHKNWPITFVDRESTDTENDDHKMALVYSSREIITDLKNLIEDTKKKAVTNHDKDAQTFLEGITPSETGIHILMLALLEPEYWYKVAHMLVSQILLVLEKLHAINEHSVLLLPENSINGVMVLGLLRSAVHKAMGVEAQNKTAVEYLSEKGVEVIPVFKDHPESSVYEFFRIVVQDTEQNQVFIHALLELLGQVEL